MISVGMRRLTGTKGHSQERKDTHRNERTLTGMRRLTGMKGHSQERKDTHRNEWMPLLLSKAGHQARMSLNRVMLMV